MTKKTTRREIIAMTGATIGIGCGAAHSTALGADGDTLPSLDDGHADMSLADRRFRRSLTLATRRLRASGKLNNRDYARFRSAAYSGLEFSVIKIFGIEDMVFAVEDMTFIQHVRGFCERRMREDRNLQRHATGQAMVAGGVFEDLFGSFSDMFSFVTDWIVENWEMVLAMILGLLVFLGRAESE